MSKWTHVAGLIRLDNMMLAMVNPAKLKSVNTFRDIFGGDKIEPEKQAIEDVISAFRNGAPSGSEGPVRVHLHVWPVAKDFKDWDPELGVSEGSLYWADLLISGDLRDKGDETLTEVKTWLKGIVLPQGAVIRQGVVEVQVQDDFATHLHHSYDLGWQTI